MNEQEFVKFLEKNFHFRSGKGIGDDASVVKIGDLYQLITTDLLIENIHFKLDYYTLEEIAYKSLAVNLSDIAAMGGKADYFYLGLGCPKAWGESKIFDFFSGLKKGCSRWSIELAGGDFSISPVMFISITMVGTAARPVFRSGAQARDLIGVTGVTGESAVGLQLLEKGIAGEPLAAKHKIVLPEIEKGVLLSGFVNAMIDVSDGLSIDLGRVLAASHKTAVLFYEKIPVSGTMRQVCARYGIDEYEAVLAGGEDYVLLFTISPEKEAALRKHRESCAYHIIGEVRPAGDNEGEITIFHHGKIIDPKRRGYDHFS